MIPQSGDPFARAYGRNGNTARACKPRQLETASKYAGYVDQGLTDDPASDMLRCVQAMQSLLSGTLQRTDLAPWIHPPFRSRFICDHVQAVLSVKAAFDAAANAAGIVIKAGADQLGVPPISVPLLEMSGAGDYQTLFEFSPTAAHVIRMKSWGISPGNAGVKNLVVRVEGGTIGGLPSAPNPFISDAEVSSHQDVVFMIQPSQSVRVKVALRDLLSPTLLTFGFCYWIFPVTKRMDSREDTMLRDGYGVDCYP